MRSHIFLFITSVNVVVATDFECPTYASIARSSVSPAVFNLERNFSGTWYRMASNEGSIFRFCDCATEEWFVDSPKYVNSDFDAAFGQPNISISSYHYTMRSQCGFGEYRIPFTFMLKGEQRHPDMQPGLLHENWAVFNHTLPGKLVPHMIFDIQKVGDDNVVAFSYVCVGKVVPVLQQNPLFTFSVYARSPHGLSRDSIAEMIQKRNRDAGEVFNTERMRYADSEKCWRKSSGAHNWGDETSSIVVV